MLQKGTYKTVDELPNLLKGKEKVYNSVDELPDLKKKEGTGLVGGSFGGGAVGTSNGQLEFPKHKIVTDNTRQPIQLRQQEPIVEGNITYIQEEHPKGIAAEAKKLKAEKPTQSTFDGIGFMTQDIIEHGGGKALENLPVGLESLNLYFDNDANNAAEYFKRRNAEIDQQLKDLNQAKGDAIQPSKGDILLDNPKINQLTGKPFDNEQSDIDREREKLIKYKANLAKAQSALAKQYASKLTKGESVTEKGKVYNRIMGDEYTLEQDRLEEKGIPIKDREKYNRDIKGLEVAQQELQDEYSDKEKDDTYYERMAELNSMGKGILNKYPEYRKEQGANLIAQLAVKDPKLKMLASMGSGELDNSIKEYLEKTHGVSKKDLKGIEYGDIPSESFLGNVAKGLYNAGSSLVTGVTRAAGTALGVDEDRLTYLNEQIGESGNKIFGNNPYEQLQDPDTGKYNYNATTIKNAIGSGIGGLLGFIGGVKGVGKVLSLTDDAAMTGYIMGSSNEHNYQKANDVLGKDAPEFEKELYATGMGYLEALAFKVLPKDKIFFNSPQTQKATKELAKSLSGMTINNINNDVLESGYKKVLKAALNTTEETVKIGGALSIAEMAKTATNVLVGDEENANRYVQEGIENIEHMGRDLAFSMGIPLGLMEIPKYRSHSNRTKQTLYDAGENPGTHVATIRQAEEKGLIPKEEADKRIEVVETMRGIVKSMPEKNPITEEPLTTNQKKEYAYNRVKEIAIKAKEAEIKDAALAPFFKKEAKELVDERTAIVTGTHDQYKETAALGDRIAATGKQKLITDVGTKSEVVDTLKDQALSTPITVSRMFKPYDAELTTDLIARNEPQKIKEELKSLKAEHKKLIEQEKKSEANEVQKNIDLLEEGLDKQKKPKEEEVTEPTPRTEVKTEKSPPSTGLSRGDEKVKEVDESTDKQRKRTIVNHLLDSGGDVDGAFEKAGYVNHNGIWVAPEALEYAKKVSPEAWQHMKDKGIRFLEGGDDSRGLQKVIAYGDKTIRGIGINERVGEFHSGHDHTVLHETAHHVWQEELTPEQREVFADDNPVSDYAKSVKEGNEKTMGKYDEEDFAELYAKNKGDINKAIEEKKNQSLSSNTPKEGGGLSRGDVEEKFVTQSGINRADAKKIYNEVRQLDEPTDAKGLALSYLAHGGKVGEDAINEVSGRVKRASLNTGARELKSSEVKARDYADKNGKGIDEIVHEIWDNLPEGLQNKIDIQDIKNELQDAIKNHDTRLSSAKEYIKSYGVEEPVFADEKIITEEEIKLNEYLNSESEKTYEHEILSDNEILNIINHVTENERENQQSSPNNKSGSSETNISNDSKKEASTNKEVVNEEAKVEVQQPAEVKSIAEEKVGGLAPETKTGEKEPPKEPAKPIEETPEDKFREKGILNRLFKAENTPKAAKEGFEKEGLKYEPQSVQEAEQIGKAMVDEYGIEDAVTLAETNKFKGGVNSAIFAESLNRLYDQELAAKTPQEKIEAAKKFAEVGIRYDEFGRGGGRDIRQIGHFYKKSPLGIQMMENAKRKEDFEQWSKLKEKSWKEFFDDMMKEPEFEKEVSAKVKEEMQKERSENRKTRTEKVHKAIDATISKWADKLTPESTKGADTKGGSAEDILKAAGTLMKKAYDAGEKVTEIVQKAIDYISEKLGHDTWDKEGFRKEWEEKLKDKTERKPLTDEELKAKILDKFRKKLKGLTDKEKEEVVRKSFQKIVESGGLDYADFKKIIADITGRGELTAEEAARLKELVKETNAVDEAAEKARTDVDAQGKRKQENREAYFKQVAKAAKATRELNEILYNRPNITKRLTSIMQLNTLGIPALVNNPIYNIVNQLGLRFPVGVLQSVIERGIQVGGKIMGKDVQPEINNLSLKTQAEFFKKLGLGVAESVEQFGTGLNRADYTAKELHTEQIRPATAIRDLWKYFKGEKNLSNEQLADKIIQATVGIPAEGVARTLNVGDKPQRFAAQGNRGAAFAKRLGLKDIDYDLFIDFPREEAFMQYKKKGLSDAEAAKKADYIADTIIKEGQRSTFQQDNMLNDVINRAFGGEKSGIGSLAKAVTISPYIKIPSNAYWSYYNLINPEVAFLQSMIYGAKAYAKKSGKYTRFLGDKYNTSAAKDLNEAKYWFAHGAVGMATRAVIVSLVGAGIARSANTGDDTKKEREGEQNYEQQGTINVSKLSAAIRGENPDDVKNGLNVQMRWFGHWGTMANAIARKEEEMTPEQKEAQEDFWSTTFGGMEIDALKDLNQGVFGNTSSLLTAVERKDFQNYGVNLINMFTNILQPAALAQAERAAMPYYTKQKADTFLGELNNTMLSRSKLYRDLTNQYPPSKVGIWGDKVEKKDNFGMRLFGISRANPDNFAQPIYDDYKKTNNIKFFPPSVRPVIEGNGQVINLPTKDAARLEELVGQQRKNMISPYVNDMATFEGSSKTYSQLTDEEKLDKLNIIYDEGYKNGKELFLKEHPEYIIPEKTKQDKREDKKESRANKKFRKAISSKY